MENRSRPAGVTVLAVLLGFVAFRGFLVMFGTDQQLLFEQILSPRASYGLALAYTICALAAAVLLWEMKPGAVAMYATWATLLVAAILVHDVTLKVGGKTQTEWWLIFLPAVVVALLLAIVGVALNRTLARRA